MSRGDLALIRQAANQDWHASRATRRRIPSVIFERLGKMEPDAPYDGREVRWQLAAARTIAAMNGANIRIVKRALRTAAAARRMAPKHPASWTDSRHWRFVEIQFATIAFDVFTQLEAVFVIHMGPRSFWVNLWRSERTTARMIGHEFGIR